MRVISCMLKDSACANAWNLPKAKVWGMQKGHTTLKCYADIFCNYYFCVCYSQPVLAILDSYPGREASFCAEHLIFAHPHCRSRKRYSLWILLVAQENLLRFTVWANVTAVSSGGKSNLFQCWRDDSAVKALAAKSDHLGLILRSYRVKGENWPVVLWSQHVQVTHPVCPPQVNTFKMMSFYQYIYPLSYIFQCYERNSIWNVLLTHQS